MSRNSKEYTESLNKFLDSDEFEIPHRSSMMMMLKELDEIYDDDRETFNNALKFREKKIVENLLVCGKHTMPFDYAAIVLAERMKELGYVIKMDGDRIVVSIF